MGSTLQRPPESVFGRNSLTGDHATIQRRRSPPPVHPNRVQRRSRSAEPTIALPSLRRHDFQQIPAKVVPATKRSGQFNIRKALIV